MRRIDIFVSSPADVQKERSVVERLIGSVAVEFKSFAAAVAETLLRRFRSSLNKTQLERRD